MALVQIVLHQTQRAAPLTRETRATLDQCFHDGVRPQDHKEAFRLAAKESRNPDIVSYLKEKDALVMDSDILPLSMQELGYQKSDEVTRYLLGQGACVDGTDEKGNTALFYACMQGRTEIFDLLIQAGADVTIQYAIPASRLGFPIPGYEEGTKADLLRVTAFAVEDSYLTVNAFDLAYGQWDHMMLYLIRSGVPGPVHKQLCIDYMSIAAEQADTDAIMTLYKHGGLSPLDLILSLRGATVKGHANTVRFLLDLGADPTVACRDAYSRRRQHSFETDLTPMAAAVAAHHRDEILDACEVLYSSGVSKQDNEALLNAAAGRGKLSLARRLIEDGVRLQAVPVDAPLEMHELFALGGLPINWMAMQTYALKTSATLLKKYVDLAGPCLEDNEDLENSLRNWFSYGFDPATIIEYVIHDYAHIPNASHKAVLRRFLWAMPDTAINNFLQEGIDAGCPGIRSGVAAWLKSRQPKDRRFTGPDDVRGVQALQLLIQCAEDAELTPDDKLWLTPTLYLNWLDHIQDGVPGQHISSVACSPPAIKLHQHHDLQHDSKDNNSDVHDCPSNAIEEEVVIKLQDIQHQVQTNATTLPSHNHVYEQLSSQKIRLLTLEPATNSDAPVACTLAVYDLQRAPRFEALSYAWGHAEYASIQVGGRCMYIRQNLHAALLRLRTDVARKLWVDAICINQTDLDEKVGQVKNMQYIFSSAQQVLVWLGESDDDSRAIFKYIHSWSPSESHGWGVVPHRSYHGSLWNSLVRLCARPWFFRTWTIQEFALSKQATVVCGEDSAVWSLFVEGVSWRFNTYDVLDGVHTESRVRELTDMGNAPYTQRIMEYAAMCQATDLRDKVYGLLGLLKHDIVIDYTLSVEAVFTNFSQTLFQAEGFELLHIYNRQSGRFPSWVLDLDTLPLTSLRTEGTYSRSEELTALLKPSFRFRENRMIIRGVKIATVIKSASVLKPEDKPGTKGYNQTLRQWEDLAMDPYVYFNTLLCYREHAMYWCMSGVQWHDAYCSGVLRERFPKFWSNVDVLLQWHENIGKPHDGDAQDYMKQMAEYCYGRRLFTTETGLGLGNENTEPGDEIVFFPGGWHPFAVRRIEGGYRLIGDCHVHGFDMDKLSLEELRSAQEFVLI